MDTTPRINKMEKINWITAGGKKILILFHADFLLDSQGDRKTAGYKEVVCEAFIDGKKQWGTIQSIVGHKKAVAAIGKIGLTREHKALYDSARAKVETEIEKHNSDLDMYAESLDHLSTIQRKLEKTMALFEIASFTSRKSGAQRR